MRRSAIASVSVLLLTALAPTPAPASAPEPAAWQVAAGDFHPEPCPEGLWPAGLDADCGFIRVPQDRRHPAEGRIEVRAVVIHSTSTDPDPTPILLLPGGPSTGGITDFSYWAYFDNTTWDDDHDIVLVDVRGIGSSTPRLGCREMDAADVRQFYGGPSIGSLAPRIVGGALAHCRQRLVRNGVDPRDYTVQETIADLEALRAALGGPRWNLMAVSADGILGLSYLRAHPSSLRSVIVDSGMTPQMDSVVDYGRGLQRELDRIFAGCRHNVACDRTYPGVERAFMRVVHRLNEQPKMITFPKFRPHPVRLRLDGAGLLGDAHAKIWPGNRFAPEEIHRLLDWMADIGAGHLVRTYRHDFGRGPVTNEHFNRFTAFGATMSYECQAVTNFLTLRDRRAAVRELPEMRRRYLGRHFDLGDAIVNARSPAGCRIWDVGRAPRRQHTMVRSRVPALVLTGGYDTGVPRWITEQALPGLRFKTYVTFPASGHQQLAFFNTASDCARAIARAFLAHPRQVLNRSCVADVPPLDFTPPPADGRPGVERFGDLGAWRFGADRHVQVGR